MALALGVKEFDTVYVGDMPVRVIETRGFEWAKIEVGAGDGLSNPAGSCRVRVYELTDKKATEILPGVFVSCGRPEQRFIEKHEKLSREYDRCFHLSRGGINCPLPANPGKLLPRLIFEAPRSITILREELYRRAKAAVA